MYCLIRIDELDIRNKYDRFYMQTSILQNSYTNNKKALFWKVCSLFVDNQLFSKADTHVGIRVHKIPKIWSIRDVNNSKVVQEEVQMRKRIKSGKTFRAIFYHKQFSFILSKKCSFGSRKFSSISLS